MLSNNQGAEENASSEGSLSRNFRILKSEEIFCGASEVMIAHKKDIYRLMITKAGKLILNK